MVFDISINFDLTKAYCELITTYVTSIILLSRVDDRKAVLGLYNAAYELINGHVDSSFPRLGQMVIDYECPLKKLSEEFIPHSKLLINALMSLLPIYLPRNTTADVWRSEQKLSLISNPSKIVSSFLQGRQLFKILIRFNVKRTFQLFNFKQNYFFLVLSCKKKKKNERPLYFIHAKFTIFLKID